MKIIRDLSKLKITEKTAIAIGKFDGLHLGHQKLLEHILVQKENGRLSVIVTFDPPPEVFFGKGERKQILTDDEKEEILAAMGVDVLFYFPMNDVNAAMPAESFVVEILLSKLNMAYICAGDDLRFGASGQGNSVLLFDLAERKGFQAEIIPKIYFEGREISSTYVREAIEAGDMKLVYDLLGRPYSFAGNVTEGYKLGRTLGFPTANLSISEIKVMPPNGVYGSKIRTSFGEYKGISNIGVKPTIGGERCPGIETYFYDYSGDLYGAKIDVMLMDFRRAERKFANIEELKAQVEADIRAGKSENHSTSRNSWS